MRLHLLSILLLTACADHSLPEVSGLTPVADIDPARDVVHVTLTAAPTSVQWVDGGATSVWAYNGQVPGPLIQARVGDTVRVDFTNNLDEPTTIHWHGLRIPDDMDGVPVIQDPVQPGESFTYEFTVPDAGTFWYHPHVRSNEQIERGLQGMLVVHEDEPPGYDTERAFVLDDAALRDGAGFYGFGLGGMDAVHGRHGNVLLANGQTELLEAPVIPGTVERWRVVNTANARTMWVDVKDADWRVVAIDGTLLEEPLDGQRLLLPVGRRFDLEVAIRGDVAPSLAVELPAGGPNWDTYPVFTGTLDVAGSGAVFLPWEVEGLVDQLPIEQEVEVVLGVQEGPVWMINGAAYGEGDDIPVRANTPTRITVRDTTGFEHPFHLHGQFFEVLERQSGTPWPGRLDTVLVHPEETVELYSTFDNPGTWMAHCHILEHAELGMMTTFSVE
jgi:FtsP/CotA-like multicopper oxidase with cupredoxin domain